MKKYLILTYSTGQTELTSYTYPFLERYCENHNIDLLITREKPFHIKEKFDQQNQEWALGGGERLYAYDLFNLYDRILWIGSDVLVQPYAPNIFVETPTGYVSGFVEHRKGEPHHAGDICGDCYNAFGILPDQYINIDVMMVDKELKEIYNYNNKDLINNIHKGKWVYQDYFNYYIKNNNIPLFDLGYKWNCMISKYLYTNTPLPNDWYFMHVTGISGEQRINFLKNYLTSNGMI
jgi:hypothetical protein